MFGQRSRGSGGDTEYKSRRGFGYHVRHGQGRAQQRHRSGHIGGREIHRGGAKDFEGNECRTGKGWYFGQEPVYVYSPSFFFLSLPLIFLFCSSLLPQAVTGPPLLSFLPGALTSLRLRSSMLI